MRATVLLFEDDDVNADEAHTFKYGGGADADDNDGGHDASDEHADA